MKINNKDIELFNLISKHSANNIDKYNLFSGEFESKRQGFEDSFIKLSSMKLITVENKDRAIIIKLPDFHEAILHGGLNELIEYKSKNEKLQNNIIESNLNTNKYSRISMVLTLIIGSLTLLALIVQIILNNKS